MLVDPQVPCSSLGLQCQQELSTRARSASESSTASLEEGSQTSSDSTAEELEGASEDKVSGLQADDMWLSLAWLPSPSHTLGRMALTAMWGHLSVWVLMI